MKILFQIEDLANPFGQRERIVSLKGKLNLLKRSARWKMC